MNAIATDRNNTRCIDLDKMLTKARTKFIKSLKLKKNRKQEGLFVVEGAKNILEVLDSDFQVYSLYVTDNFYQLNSDRLSGLNFELTIATGNQLAAAGSFKNNDQALALVKITNNQAIQADNNEFGLILDNINDPGNLGTIIRVCDWYGIRKIIVSEDTVDLYNPKVIAASMGSFTRLKIFYTDLIDFITSAAGPFIGTFMEGVNIHDFQFDRRGYIILGNESNGIRPEIEELVNSRLMIPSFGNAESLNVGVAAGILLDNLSRIRI